MDKPSLEFLFQDKQFLMLPFKKGTKILLREIVDKHTNINSLKLSSHENQVHIISYKRGVLLLIVTVPGELGQPVSIKITGDYLLVSCNSYKNEKYIRYYASLSLNYLLFNGDSADFKDYY